MNNIKLFILDLFFPNRCPICDDFIEYNNFVCDKCSDKLKKYASTEGSICRKCGKNICNGHEDLFYSRIMSCYCYKDMVKDGIYSLKDHSKNFGFHIGKLLSEKIVSDSVMCHADYIVPVPMSRKSFRKRGYNQAYVIAKEISERTGIKLLNNALFKKNSAVQHTLNADERRKNVYSFYSSDMDLSGKKIIICDDVLTTGSTMNKCAQLLTELNASEIYGAVGAVTENIKNKNKEYIRALALK